MKNWKVQSQSQFLTSFDLAHYKRGDLALRGILRIKYDNHENPDNIQWELEREGTKLELGKWYEVDVDVVFARIFHNVKDRETSPFALYRYEYLSEFREVK